ncbi:hypothetical protein C8F04DRAFT_974253 [Mycena alexandri]|uniref:Uncharacterized protein n=1 Tax=Mycena alexandri TaxID=1745969 RepID=A0AAD6WN07_9AGAR|nr:hypothetical protein C8F04DRAFT_974253 [Mycena alexandri]
MLRTTMGVVSGSVALLMATDMAFKPGDMDIYVPASQDQTALAIAQTHLGFTLKKLSARTYQNNVDIKRVHTLKKGPKKINIIMTKGENAMAAIFQFHSMIVMNVLTAAGLYCASFPVTPIRVAH